MAGARGPVTSGPAGHHGERLGPRLTGRKEACRCPVSVGPAGVAGLGRAHLPVVVGWGLRHRPPQTRWLRQHICSLTDLGAEESKVKAQADAESSESPRPCLPMASFSLCPHAAGSGSAGDPSCPHKGTDPLLGPPPGAPSSQPHLIRVASQSRPPPSGGQPGLRWTQRLSPSRHPPTGVHWLPSARHWAHGDRGTMAATPSQSSTHLGREHTQARPARTGEPRARGCSGAARRQARGSRRAQGLRWPNGVHSRP